MSSPLAPPRRVGLLVGRENTFPEPFLDAVKRKGRDLGVTAELAVLGGTAEFEEPACAVLVGTAVVNDPFWWQADEKFFECTLARKLGIAVPRTVALPNKDYIPDIDREVSLRNLLYPLDWEAILRYVGLPAVLKPNVGGGWKDVHIVNSLDELIGA